MQSAAPQRGSAYRWASTIADPKFRQPRTAYFGVALRTGYLQRIHEAQRLDDGGDGFQRVFLFPYYERSLARSQASTLILTSARTFPRGSATGRDR